MLHFEIVKEDPLSAPRSGGARGGRQLATHKIKDDLPGQLERYIGQLVIGQGRFAGQPFPLQAWERKFLRGAFSQSGDAALSLARGGGKTSFCAAIACAAVDVDGPLVEPMGECILIASSFDQGLIAFRHMLHFLQPSFDRYGEGPRGRFRIQDSANRATITDRETKAMVRVLGSDPRRLHGLAPRLMLFDEIAQWPPERLEPMLAALKTSRGKIAGSKALWLGTRPDTPDHPFQKALDGGVRYSQVHAASKEDKPFQRRTWKRANPGLDNLPDLEAVIKEEAADAKRDGSALQSFMSLRLNQGLSDVVERVLLSPGVWTEIEIDEVVEQDGGHILGLDLGQNAAMSAASAYFPSGQLDAFACFPRVPSLQKRGLADGCGNAYLEMAKRNELIIMGERVSDIAELLRESRRRWGDPVAITCDRWREAELIQELEAVGFPVVPLITRGMGFLDGATDVRAFQKACLAGKVHPLKSLLLRSAMSAVRLVTDPAGNSKIAKGGQGRKARSRDDAAASSILAVAEGSRRWPDGFDEVAPEPYRSVIVR